MMAWLPHFCFLVCCLELLLAKPSEYQLLSENQSQCELLRGLANAKLQGDVPQCAEDGRFRPVQCSGQGQECWCVDAEGQEIIGTRTNSSAPHCMTPCQLQSVLRCSPSGLFEEVQCDSNSGQCWCIDKDGTELYGTRQSGIPSRCPGSCEVRSRRLLHSSAPHSPPQCDDSGNFLPVQCIFINSTDGTELDLLTTFNWFPEAFETFSSFRKLFPAVSSYCFCSDSWGRELRNTGVELLLSDVYDSTFVSHPPARSVAQSGIYRVLQRRLLGVRLAITGHFRCPSACEEEQQAAKETSSVYVPSCENGGAFASKQCQKGGQCWCVDHTGKELPGTRQQGDSMDCHLGPDDCPSQRHLALSHLLSGPIAPPLQTSFAGKISDSCLSLLQPLRDLLPALENPLSFLSHLIEVLGGLFPTVGGALQALASSSPQQLQENLFGGSILKNAASFNFSGVVGAQGLLGLDQLSAQNTTLREGQVLVQYVSRALEDPAFLSGLQLTLSGHSRLLPPEKVLIPLLRSCSGQYDSMASNFVPSCSSNRAFQEVQCGGGECWCVDPRGKEVSGSRTAGRPPRCPSLCERQRAMAVKIRANMAASTELFVPACSEDGKFLPLQCAGSRCFCVDTEGNNMSVVAAGGAVSCPTSSSQSSSPGRCSLALAEVTAFRMEVKNIITLSNSSHQPLGYGFLLADGLVLSPAELQMSQTEEELRITDRLLSRSKAALRLAAFSTVQMFLPSHRRSYELFTPQCDADGQWLNTQCYHSTGQCWCVDEDGEYIADSLTSRSLQLPKCLTRCQRAQAHTLLSGWKRGSDIMTTSYKPLCDEDGSFSVLQTDGAAGWCVSPLTGEVIQAATPSLRGHLTCPSRCELQGSQCRPDGSFLPMQCDVTSCWCVSEEGWEIRDTRTRRQTGQAPSCDRPLCPTPIITHGALLCQPAVNGHQKCNGSCHHGYQNALSFSSFLCDTKSQLWESEHYPLGGACQMSQPVQSVWSSQLWILPSSCSQLNNLQSVLLHLMTRRGLCSMQLPVSGHLVSVCDDSTVGLHCDNDNLLRLTIRWSSDLSDLPTSDLPDLQTIGLFLNESRLLQGVQGILESIQSMLTSQPQLVSITSPSFACSRGYRLDHDRAGCLVCPAGTLSREGACPLCPQGTYQDQEGQDYCSKCPRGYSLPGASSINQCVTECQRRGLRCSEQGDFLPAQPDFLSGRWRCVSSGGADLDWTNSDKALTDEECSVLNRFQAVPGSDVIVGAENSEVLQVLTADLISCLHACADEPSCHHVALFNTHSQCELYSTHTANTKCNTSQQTRGFLGNPQAELFDWLSCFPRVKGRASDLLVIRKKGAEFSSSRQQQHSFVRMKMMKVLSGVFRTQVFSSKQTSLSDVHRFCQDACSQDTCCHGYILNQNSLNAGSLLCGWLRAPSVLMCGDQDWDVNGWGTADRVCGAGLTYNKQKRRFIFDFGGQKFTITDSALPDNSKNNKDYQASIISFQAIYLSPDVDPAAEASPLCPAASELSQPLDASILLKFQPVSEDDVLVDRGRKVLSLSFWLNRNKYGSQQALHWCLSRCDAEPKCSVADLRDAESAVFFSCSLYPDTRVCGAYDNPLRQTCHHVLDAPPDKTYSKTVNLSGPVKSFYERVPFQKMVSYSVRNRFGVTANTSLSEGFMLCERRCDEDPCCRGIGFIREKQSAGISCLSLISLGIQTCSEEDSTSWRTQDCTSSVQTGPEPLGWYQKPVNQWSSDAALCPEFTLKTPKKNVSQDQWTLHPESLVLVDPSLSTYDVIHISRDITVNPDKTRDWCLHACEGVDTCVAVSLREVESATRCILYADTRVCGLSSAPTSSNPTSFCTLVIREAAPKIYLKTAQLPVVTSISIPSHGTLQGVAVEAILGSVRKTVVQFLGVPYAHSPIGSLRFEAAQPADWTGTWDATKPRPSCIQPGDSESAASSEDCLYLNIFTPADRRGRVPVLVFFFNSLASQSPGLLDGSSLAAVGNIVVVTASYRVAALGFLSTGTSGLHGNYGLTDQEAVLRWVNTHISLVGGDSSRVTVGAEQYGADIASLHLLSSSSPLFQRMLLMGGSVFSPSVLQTPPSSRRLALQLATELGCSDVTDDAKMVACLRVTPAYILNAAQTRLLAVSGPFQSWAPVRQSATTSSLHRVDLLIGTSQHDGLVIRARRVKDFEALQGRADGKTAFYEALSRSLGGVTGSELLKEAAVWFYSLDHSPSAAGYNLFSRALNNATRDLFIICPSLRMASHWAKSKANVFLYHQPLSSTHSRADVSVPLDVQLMFGFPHHPINTQRFTSSDRRLSLAMMTYISSFIQTGNPNPSPLWSESVLPHWPQVLSTDAPPTYLELIPTLQHHQGLSQNSCSFWNQLGSRLTSASSEPESLQPVLIPELPLVAPSNQSRTQKDAYS